MASKQRGSEPHKGDEMGQINRDSITIHAGDWDYVAMEYRGRIFHGVTTAEVRVDPDGTIYAWGDIGGHWTLHHAISERGQRAIRAAAQAAQ